MKDITDPKKIDAIEDELQNLDIRTAPKLTDEDRETRLSKYRKDPKQQVTMRLPQSVIEGLQTRAAESGIPYQTLATTVLSRYIHGALLDKETFQAMAPTFTLPPGFVWPWESAEPHKDNNAEGKDRKVS